MVQQKENPFDTSAAAQTGVSPTSMVAIEQYFPAEQRIIHDDLALKILPSSYQFLIKLMRVPALRTLMITLSETRIRGIWSGILVRKRYIDDRVSTAVSENTVDAVVNLGAGYDTRVYRLPALAAVPVWEVDQSVNITAKQAGLKKALGTIPANVTLVPINFMEDDLGTVLAAHSYANNKRTFLIWEAVSQYLTETAVRRIFDFLAQAETGSRLAFTYVLKDFVEGKEIYGLEIAYERLVVMNQLWHFGLAPQEVADFLGEYGWHLIEDLGYDELADRYMKPTGRDLPSMAIERMVYAEKL